MSALSYVYSDRTCRGGRRALFAYRQTLAALAVSAVAGLAIFATTAGSLMEGAMAAPPAIKSPPPGWIDLAFADVGAASARFAVRPQQNQIARPQNTRKQDPCADFVYYFLNTSCSAKRVSAARRDGLARRAVASRTVPVPSAQNSAQDLDRVTLAATMTTATD
ncbi:MAG: hypothetical protein WA268_08490 [Xanthobacteraceae bacterium]